MSHHAAFEANKALWNGRVPHHLTSRMYDVEGFITGRNSLTSIELELLGDVRGKRILHLQCHFGQDTLSLARMGAQVTGLDISDAALAEARALAERCGLQAEGCSPTWWTIGLSWTGCSTSCTRATAPSAGSRMCDPGQRTSLAI